MYVCVHPLFLEVDILHIHTVYTVYTVYSISIFNVFWHRNSKPKQCLNALKSRGVAVVFWV